MADTKISALPATSLLEDTDELVLASLGTNKKITGAALKASMPAPPSGGGDDANYVFTQASASDTWLVTHNLGKFPSVTVIDSGDRVLIPDVIYDDLNNVRVGFAAPTSGKAVFN